MPQQRRGAGSEVVGPELARQLPALLRAAEKDIHMETRVLHLPWYPPDVQHHGLAPSSNTDTPKAKGLPGLGPNLCTACSTASTRALLLTYPLAFLASQLQRTP